MDINSVIKRNNPVWNAQTKQRNITLAAAGSPSFVTDGVYPATYIMITNGGAATIEIKNMQTGAPAHGIKLSPGATFEIAVDVVANSLTEGIIVESLGAGGEIIIVTYFGN